MCRSRTSTRSCSADTATRWCRCRATRRSPAFRSRICCRRSKIDAIAKRTAGGGAEITKLVGTSAWYAPGQAAAEMVEAILKDKKKILPCSVYLQGEYGDRRPVRRRAGEARRTRRRADHPDQADRRRRCRAEEVRRIRQRARRRDRNVDDGRQPLYAAADGNARRVDRGHAEALRDLRKSAIGLRPRSPITPPARRAHTRPPR